MHINNKKHKMTESHHNLKKGKKERKENYSESVKMLMDAIVAILLLSLPAQTRYHLYGESEESVTLSI